MRSIRRLFSTTKDTQITKYALPLDRLESRLSKGYCILKPTYTLPDPFGRLPFDRLRNRAGFVIFVVKNSRLVL
jgi:hypothetical protein